jgi:hypothetical protein
MVTRILASVVGLVVVGLGIVVATRIQGKRWRDLDGKARERILLWVVLCGALPSIAAVVTLSLTGVI